MKIFNIGDKITCTKLSLPAEILGIYDTGEYNEYWVRPDYHERTPGRITQVVDDIGGDMELYDPEAPTTWSTTHDVDVIAGLVEEVNQALSHSGRRLKIEKQTWGSDSGDSGVSTNLSLVLQVRGI